MVFINSKKYACESCIKGHRSSSCHHNDRPLFEIKKKGRPVSQCEKCREARQARRIHAKCTCDSEKSAGPSAEPCQSASKKGKRFIPTVPSLPNGLKDAFKSPKPIAEESSGMKRQVDTLLNPCHCKDVWTCKCKSSKPSSSSGSGGSVSPSIFNDGLSALAHVAACCSPASAPTLPLPPSLKAPGNSLTYERNGTKIVFDKTSPYPSSSFSSIGGATQSRSSNIYNAATSFHPIIAGPSASDSPTTFLPPSFPVTRLSPSASIATTITMSDDYCGCGQRCACAGCAMHASGEASGGCHGSSSNTDCAPGHGFTSHKANCAADCPTCVDYDGGVELPLPAEHQSSQTFLDQFFSRAATLPPPPPSRARTQSVNLDPTNVLVYPPMVFASDAERDARARAFGLVSVPKLECCGGRCSCPDNMCGCRNECGGCCADDSRELRNTESRQVSPSVSFARGTPQPTVATPSRGGCCQ